MLLHRISIGFLQNLAYKEGDEKVSLRNDFVNWLKQEGFEEQSEVIQCNLAKVQSSLIRVQLPVDSIFDIDRVEDVASLVQRLSSRRVFRFSLAENATAIWDALLVYQVFLAHRAKISMLPTPNDMIIDTVDIDQRKNDTRIVAVAENHPTMPPLIDELADIPPPDGVDFSDASTNEKRSFFKWLSTQRARKYSPTKAISCLDIISKYAIQQKIAPSDVWYIKRSDEFGVIYDKIVNRKQMQNTHRDAYNTFLTVGRLYIKYLQEKYESADQNANTDCENTCLTQSSISNEIELAYKSLDRYQLSKDGARLMGMNQESFKKWMVTHPNTNGTPYSIHVARKYVWALQTAAGMLDIALPAETPNIFACHTVSDLEEMWRLFENAKNFSEINTYTQGALTSGYNCLLRYYNYLVAGKDDGSIVEDANIAKQKPISDLCKSEEIPPQRVDFSHPELCAQSRPVSCIIRSKTIIAQKIFWSQLLVAITQHLIAEDNPYLSQLETVALYRNVPFFMDKKAALGTSSQLPNGKWIYTNFNTKTMVTLIADLCKFCGIDLGDVEILYLPQTAQTPSALLGEADIGQTSHFIEDNVKVLFTSILAERFPNGIRPNSVIDTNKLKSYIHEITGKDTNVDIPAVLNIIGLHHGDKVYVVPTDGKEKLSGLIDQLIVENNRLFYYDEFYNAHADLLLSMNIFSSELMKTVLMDTKPTLYYARSYFSTLPGLTGESEVLGCFQNAVCMSYDQFHDRLPYIPLDKIRQILAFNNHFIWVSTGIYTHVSRMVIDDNELAGAKQRIEEEINNRGYASLTFFEISESLGLNPELSETAVRNGLYQTYLADRYEKRGNIITQKGAVLNLSAVLQDFCMAHARLTLSELLDFEKEINGRATSQSLYAINDTMIRLDKDTFIADSEITFDVEATDCALALFVHTDVVSLRSVTSFSTFPYIDVYPWNWYLLESYCRRFSKQFMYQCLSVNSRNVGAIYRKSAGFLDYTAVMAAAVAQADIKLEPSDVGDFLFERGYIAHRTSAVQEVTAKARILRER